MFYKQNHFIIGQLLPIFIFQIKLKYLINNNNKVLYL